MSLVRTSHTHSRPLHSPRRIHADVRPPLRSATRPHRLGPVLGVVGARHNGEPLRHDADDRARGVRARWQHPHLLADQVQPHDRAYAAPLRHLDGWCHGGHAGDGCSAAAGLQLWQHGARPPRASFVCACLTSLGSAVSWACRRGTAACKGLAATGALCAFGAVRRSRAHPEVACSALTSGSAQDPFLPHRAQAAACTSSQLSRGAGAVRDLHLHRRLHRR
jgi:hypothetical protein